ncbi:hypothetical protein SL1157_2929 [Ruegeria lacuscaerulensis ITI-1157]|nr:hypothetical protein SL1157_2929 [Ruegeria lacuscaerulensis ITI-1157]
MDVWTTTSINTAVITAERPEIGGGSARDALLTFKYCNGLTEKIQRVRRTCMIDHF